MAASTVSQWVNDIQPPCRRGARDIARALGEGVRVDEVLVRAGYQPQTPGYVLPEEREPEPEPPPALDYIEIIRDQFGRLRGEILSIEEVMPREGVPVEFLGRVPADAVRWVQFEERNEVRDVLSGWLNARAPEDFRVVQASGDCLLTSYGHIAAGDYVPLALLHGEEPLEGRIVLVRLGDECSLKLWDQEGEWVALRTGGGEIIERVPVREGVPIGVFLRRWTP